MAAGRTGPFATAQSGLPYGLWRREWRPGAVPLMAMLLENSPLKLWLSTATPGLSLAGTQTQVALFRPSPIELLNSSAEIELRPLTVIERVPMSSR
ncbi:unnamed protein product [Nippostrongylus brasiliensis]|uniref:General secretion pathway protein I n=1 Tax=Nippostrongylus brasiliensis TaxID=27835 RepID=A0A0N4YC15_NIPBR|nr:hypothetical protein Q1695_014464 [Nippostrongylus brasiliensis]VDL77650.1 unnamed protein product [Nippostrongylus brasiliensis]